MLSEYLTSTLWRQREERMPHELEHQRVVQERLSEQVPEQQRQEKNVPSISLHTEIREAHEPTVSASELEQEFVNQ